jgi:heme-degrading monooxygenase HmoA
MKENTSRALYVVSTWVREDRLEEWYRWHAEVHIPDVAAQPGVIRAIRYRVVEDNMPREWTAQYVTVYEFESLDAFEAYRASDEAARLRADHTDRYGASVKLAREVLVEDVAVPGSAAP